MSEFITVKEAAGIAAKSERTIWSWLEKEYLTKYESGKNTLISRAELMEFITPKKV